MGLRLSCALRTVVELHPSVGSALVFYHITSALLHFLFYFNKCFGPKGFEENPNFCKLSGVWNLYSISSMCQKRKRIFSLCVFLPFKSHFYNLMSKFQGCNMILLSLKEKKKILLNKYCVIHVLSESSWFFYKKLKTACLNDPMSNITNFWITLTCFFLITLLAFKFVFGCH